MVLSISSSRAQLAATNSSIQDDAEKRYYRLQCPLSAELVKVAVDPDTGDHVLIGSGGRSLQERFKPENSDGLGHAVFTRNVQESDNVSSWQIFDARRCMCTGWNAGIDGDFFCPTPTSSCAYPISSSLGYGPVCFVETKRRKFAAAASNLILAMYILFFAMLLFTKRGRAVFDHLLSLCWPGWNNRVVQRILQRDPMRAKKMLYMAARRRRRELARQLGRMIRENADTEASTAIAAALAAPAYTIRDSQIELEARPTSLALKTRVFRVDESSGNADDLDNNACCICFGDILDRDVVGDLTCCHMFHKECIKDWLKRRNTCPLCLSDGIASPRYDKRDKGLNSQEAVDVSEDDIEPSPVPTQPDSPQNESEDVSPDWV